MPDEIKTQPGGGDHRSTTIGAGKPGAPQPLNPQGRVLGENPDGSVEEVPLEKQAPPEALPGMPENSSATPGFTDVPPDPTKQAQAEQEAKAAKESERESTSRP